ncbi:MAG: hypothetical protein KJ598_03880 [Nanoarchaeota archaeon]|nr:hypothetical protein [Nanoarchaeota archaeon]MBU1644269.1 hypothetical protein [Nanoarchaeota archaeon]
MNLASERKINRYTVPVFSPSNRGSDKGRGLMPCPMEEGEKTQKTLRLKVAKALKREYKEVFPNDID